MNIRKSVCCLLCALAVGLARAQLEEPVRWQTEWRTVSDKAAELVFTATIDAGWHVYGPQEMDGPTQATFTAETLKGAELDGPLKAVGNIIRQYEDLFGCEVYFFEGKGQLVQPIRLTGGAYTVEGYLEYGACNDESCLPPTSVEVNFTGVAPAVTTDRSPSPHDDATATDDQQQIGSQEKGEGITPAAGESPEAATTSDPAPATDEGAQGSASTIGGQEEATVDEGWWTPVINQLKAYDEGGEATAADSPLWKIFLLGILGGLVALVTPCVWPIIPMTVSFFLKRTGDKRKGLRDACIYGVSIVVIYVALGLVVTALFGASALNALSTNALFNIFFFLLLLVFAISFFGAFELTLPASWSNAVDSKAERTGGLLGIFLMAFTLTLVSFSCTGPIIGFLLVEVSTSGSILAPTIGMLGFALALALPFSLFALFPNWLKQMPRSGSWMNTVKVALGFVELAFALKFLSVADLAYGWRLLDRETFLALWIALALLLAAYLLGKVKFPHDDPDDRSVGVTRFLLALVCLAFAIYMVPGLWGAPLKAISAFAPPMKTQDFNLVPEAEVKPLFVDYDAGMEYARQAGKPVLIDFTGYGCVNCRKMEAAVWTDAEVAETMTGDYVLVQLYVDDKTALTEPILLDDGTKLRTVGDKWSYLQRHKFGANAQPFYVLLDNEGLPLAAAYAFDDDVSHYLRFLRCGLNEYAHR